jgi:hypothetical protein
LLLLVGEAHGSLGVGVGVPDGLTEPLAVGVGVSAAPRRSAPDDGLRLSTGAGIEVDEGDAEPDADPDGAGEALDCSWQNALCTGSGDDDSLDVGEADADVSEGMDEGLSEGRPDGLGPPPSANAVAAIDANTATVVAPRARDLRDIDPPPTPFTSPRPDHRNRQNG